MKVKVLIIALVALASCQPGKDWRKGQIEKREAALMASAQTHTVDTSAVNSLLGDYESYASDFKCDTLSANYLFKAADFYRYMHRPSKSVMLYSKIYNDYPTISKRPYSLFLQGFIYENEMGKMDSARIKYEQFLGLYPSNPIWHDVKMTLDNLGKTPEQMIEEFQAKEQEDSLEASAKK